MSNDPIDPNGIPQFTGDLEQLERDVADLRREASQFRGAGSDVHTDFQGLSAFYEAPEAEDLFATTKPVKTKTDAFADDLEQVAQALSEYATEVRPIVARLKRLRTEASAFYIDEISTDEDWRKDDDKYTHNNRLVEEVKAATQAFYAAEISCHNKITGLVDGVQLRPSSDGTTSCDTYGYTDEVLDQVETFPWGGKVEKDRDGIDWLIHKAKDVGKGFFVDGLGGTVKALGTLVGRDGWGAAGEAWTNLGKLATGLSLSLGPTAGIFWLAKDEQLPPWLRDSRRAVVDTGKGLIAYDQWSKNPARAAGLVGFNALTIVATRGAGSAAKGGAMAKTISGVGKVGRAVDPFTYAAKGVQFGATKVGDLGKLLKNGRVDVGAGTGEGLGLADDAVRPPAPGRGAGAPVRPPSVPDDAKLVGTDAKGNPVYVTDRGVTVVATPLDDLKRSDPSGSASGAERAGGARPEASSPIKASEPRSALATAHTGDGSAGAAGHVREASPGHSAVRGGTQSHGTPTSGGGSQWADAQRSQVAHDYAVDHAGEGRTAHDEAHAGHGADDANQADLDVVHRAQNGQGLHNRGTPSPTPQTHTLGPDRPGFSIMRENDLFYRSALRSKAFPGHYDVVAHGTQHSTLMDTAGRELTARQMADIIRRRPDYEPGMPIRLLSCNTGHVDGTFARQLARDLGVPVLAPDGFLHADGFGRFGVDREARLDAADVTRLPDSFYRYHPGGYVEEIPRSEWVVE
ncbi:hypothetical protein [Streptomyces sp. G45]|uniref:hypothetical protein n=1 Tax=Streptomyces sp. G45 TaxID=3406627 RepID=UPI003C166533